MNTEIINISAPPSLLPSLRKAMAEWNRVMAPLAQFIIDYSVKPHVVITFGKVDRSRDETRIAQCADLTGKKWLITLADDTKWATTWWQQTWGLGEDATATLLHELGHVFDLPHSDNPYDVMSPVILTKEKIGTAEGASYKEYFEKHVA